MKTVLFMIRTRMKTYYIVNGPLKCGPSSMYCHRDPCGSKIIGEFMGRVVGVATPPPFWLENFTSKRSFGAIFRAVPLQNRIMRIMDKSCHERLQHPIILFITLI